MNDLDLEVRTETGAVYFPNGGDAPDRRNTVEQVGRPPLPPPASRARPQVVFKGVSGTVSVTVRATALPRGPQLYSLVVRGGFQRTGLDLPTGMPEVDKRPVKRISIFPIIFAVSVVCGGLACLVLLLLKMWGSRREARMGKAQARAVVVMDGDVGYA